MGLTGSSLCRWARNRHLIDLKLLTLAGICMAFRFAAAWLSERSRGTRRRHSRAGSHLRPVAGGLLHLQDVFRCGWHGGSLRLGRSADLYRTIPGTDAALLAVAADCRGRKARECRLDCRYFLWHATVRGLWWEQWSRPSPFWGHCVNRLAPRRNFRFR